MIKNIEKEETYFVKFSEEELESLGLEKGDKLEVDLSGGCIQLKKLAKIEIDLDDFSKDDLMRLITEADERQILVSERIVEIILEIVKETDV